MSNHHVRLDRVDEGHRLSIAGAFDAETVFHLRTSLADIRIEPGETLIADLSATDFMDSSGVGFLVGLRRRAIAGTWTFRTTGARGLTCPC